MCIRDSSDGDLVVDGSKVLGSAQRRLKHSLLQHGSLLFKQSEFTPELPGLLELSGKHFQLEVFAQRMSKALGDALGFEFSRSILTEGEAALAKELEMATFGSLMWTQKR